MKDIETSLERALLDQGWLFADRWARIGNPFVWVDADRMGPENFVESPYSLLQMYSMFYEYYPTRKELLRDDHDAVEADLRSVLRGALDHYFPVIPFEASMANNIKCTAGVRTQDYCAIRLFCDDLPAEPRHMDLGPGLGSHALYSLRHLNSRYYGVEASPFSYGAQRLMFRYLAENASEYFDPVAAERVGAEKSVIMANLADPERYRIKHVPSWYLDGVPAEGIDLVTGTWMLNEITPAGIVWLMHHAMRALAVGGYFYIRDSGKRKPNRHQVNYDALLQEFGFEPAGSLEVENRVDMFGFPRAYRKTRAYGESFDTLFERCYTRFAVTVHQGEYMQNIPGAEQDGKIAKIG